METNQNLQYIYSKAAYPRGFLFSDRSRRDSTVPATRTEFNAASKPQLTPTPMDPAAFSISEDDSYRKGMGQSIVERLQASSIHTGIVLAGMLMVCVFVGLAILAAAEAQAELHREDAGAEDDAKAAVLHFEKFGQLQPSLDVNRPETTQKETSSRKVSVITRPPPQRKSHSFPFVYQARRGSTRNTLRGGRNRDMGKWTASSEVEYPEGDIAPWPSRGADTTVAPTHRRVGDRRHLPAKKSGRHSARQNQNLLAHRRRHVQQHAEPPVGDVEKESVKTTTIDTERE